MSVGMMGNPPIVVGVDGSYQALRAVRWGTHEAVRRGAPLLLLDGIGAPEPFVSALPPGDKLRQKVRERGAAVLREALSVAERVAKARVESRMVDDPGPDALRKSSPGARMIVLGATGRGGWPPFAALGSTAIQVIAHAECPVVVVRGRDDERYLERDPIVVGVDGGPMSDVVVEWAFDEAAMRDAPLIAVHVFSDAGPEALPSDAGMYLYWESAQESQERALAERLAGWADKYPDVAVQRIVVPDQPRHKLLELSARAQLLVVGSRGRGGFEGLLLGSTSQALVNHAECPVMVVRPEASEASTT